jgi:hypothetical protein
VDDTAEPVAATNGDVVYTAVKLWMAFSQSRASSLDGMVDRPLEPRTGAFIALGRLSADTWRFKLAAERGGLSHEANYSTEAGWS